MKLRLWIGSGWGRERGLLGVKKSGAIIFGDLIGAQRSGAAAVDVS